jgi:hypothetical protein
MFRYIYISEEYYGSEGVNDENANGGFIHLTFSMK